MSYTVIPAGYQNAECAIEGERLFFMPTGEVASKWVLQEHLAVAKRRKIAVETREADGEPQLRTFSVHNGHMRLGCCRFSKANTRKILSWLEA
ncbi:MAG: hypothetical protein ACREBG_09180 [Pyrinomonadaceae bacterium]